MGRRIPEHGLNLPSPVSWVVNSHAGTLTSAPVAPDIWSAYRNMAVLHQLHQLLDAYRNMAFLHQLHQLGTAKHCFLYELHPSKGRIPEHVKFLRQLHQLVVPEHPSPVAPSVSYTATQTPFASCIGWLYRNTSFLRQLHRLVVPQQSFLRQLHRLVVPQHKLATQTSFASGIG